MESCNISPVHKSMPLFENNTSYIIPHSRDQAETGKNNSNNDQSSSYMEELKDKIKDIDFHNGSFDGNNYSHSLDQSTHYYEKSQFLSFISEEATAASRIGEYCGNGKTASFDIGGEKRCNFPIKSKNV